MNHSADWLPDSFRRIEGLSIGHLTIEIIEDRILGERRDTAERILLSISEHVSILEALAFDLIDLMQLISELLGNENKVQYDKYWQVVLSNDLLYLNMSIIIQIQNIILWISFLNEMAKVSSPEFKHFYDECSQQLIRWGRGWYAPAEGAKDLEGLADHIGAIQRSIVYLTRTKAWIGDLLRTGFSNKV